MQALKVGVVGVRGIGKFHAKWYARHGCEVVAFAGSSTETAGELGEMMRRDFGFRGRADPGVAAMLERESLDAVSVCSPAAVHAEHALACLEAGAHVLCEKPLVWDASLTADDMRRQTDQLVETARRRDQVFAVNTQYPACIEAYREVVGVSEAPPAEFDWEMEIRDRGHRPEYLWADTAPHAISLLVACLPGETYRVADLDHDLSAACARVAFTAVDDDGRELACRWRFAQVAGSQMVRRFGFDGRVVDVVSEKTAPNEVTTFLAREGARIPVPDMMEVSIHRFIDACHGRDTPLVDAVHARRNMACLLDLSRRMGVLA